MSLNVKRVDLKFHESFSLGACVSDPSSYSEIGSKTQGKWAAKEGLPLPLGASWVEDEQAFNFAVYAEHALKDDEEAQKMIQCGQFLGQMFAGGTFQDDAACH